MDLLGKNRSTVVERTSVVRIGRDSIGFPKFAFEDTTAPEEVWWAIVHVREGQGETSSRSQICSSQSEAEAYIRRFPVGQEVDDTYTWLGFERQNHEFVRTIVDAGTPFYGIRSGDEDLYLPWKVLRDAGISDSEGLKVSSQVMQFLGKNRVGELRTKFGDNWEAVAEFEYCWVNLPKSSPAFIAAACRYAYFVLEDDFTAGFLLRDLEVLVHGIEAGAEKAAAIVRAASEGGKARARAHAPKSRLVVEEMSRLVGAGKSVSSAASILASNGVGSSAAANRQLWGRHKKTAT